MQKMGPPRESKMVVGDEVEIENKMKSLEVQGGGIGLGFEKRTIL